jgi:hypothetical protein
MPAAASVHPKKLSARSCGKWLPRKLRDNFWAEKLLHMILGATMTQVALSRFLIREGIIDGQRLIDLLDQRGVQWSKTASDDALLPLVTLMTRIKGAEEPDFPHRVRAGKAGNGSGTTPSLGQSPREASDQSASWRAEIKKHTCSGMPAGAVTAGSRSGP